MIVLDNSTVAANRAVCHKATCVMMMTMINDDDDNDNNEDNNNIHIISFK